MSGPGELRQRLLLEVPVETADGAGGVVRSHAAGPLLWASLTPVSARGETVADARGVSVTHRILIRMRAGITTRHRFRKGMRLFEIASLREQDETGRFLVIEARERRD